MAKNEKDKQTAHMTQHRKLKNKQHEPIQKTKGDLRCSGRVIFYCRDLFFTSNSVNEMVLICFTFNIDILFPTNAYVTQSLAIGLI